MNYGYFDDKNREYVITNPKTPVKWINYVGTLAFGGFIDHTGGSLICKGDPATNRIVKYIPQLPASDFKGETAYLRIRTDRRYTTFSPYFVPTLGAYDLYECHVGLLYTRILSEFNGIRTDVTIFVPRCSQQLIRRYIFTNLNDKPVHLDFIPVVEYTHPDALKQFTNADWIPQTMQSRLAHEKDGLKIIIQYPFMFKNCRVNYFTSNHPVSSFETDRRKFLGDNEYGTWADPISLKQPELDNNEAHRGDNICALLHHLGTLKSGESRSVVTLLGQAAGPEEALPEIIRYRQTDHVEKAIEDLASFWDELLRRLQVHTPDPAMNSMLNIHNPRQCYITKNWSRYLSLYQLGLGADRGIGFRDSAQDVMGILGMIPDEGRELIRKLLHIQKRNGSAMHQFNPATLEASAGDSEHEKDRPHYYGDDHLWIILAVSAYLKETGDMDFLNDPVPFYDKDENRMPQETATVLEHLRRALDFTHSNTGCHGLPLLGFADWNDSINLPEGAESLFIAHLYGKALQEMIELMEALDDPTRAALYRVHYDEMKERVNACAWDGAWYVRYFDREGNPLGSQRNQEGRIFVNAQSWAILSGFATPERAKTALDSVYRLLNTRNGIKLSAPGFKAFDPIKGGVTTYPPGAKENGGIFLHTNPWAMIAETLMAHGDRAFQYYHQINPAARNDGIETFECAPYNYPQNILGDEHPQFGLARNSWLSGTSSWTYQAATRYILGLLPTYRGLAVNPCIPKDWPGFRAEKWFRGTMYRITVSNPHHVQKGIRSMMVDKRPVHNGIAPVFDDGKIHTIDVEMG